MRRRGQRAIWADLAFSGRLGKTPPASNPHIRLRSRKMGGSNFGRKARIYKINSAWPATIPESGEAEKHTNSTPPWGLWRGYRGGFFSLISISLLEIRSTRFEARGLGGFLCSCNHVFGLHRFTSRHPGMYRESHRLEVVLGAEHTA